ncbi:MAG: S8 family serine peptidase, partial [Pyrinomonadaceae bacterium]
MNRNNLWIHLALAVSLIAVAAIIGQVSRWETTEKWRGEKPAPKQQNKACAMARSAEEREPEVLVKFRSNLSLSEIQKIAAKQNDRIEDEIESVAGLTSIDDLDGRSAQQVVEEYKRLGDVVEYAEPNLQIRLDPETSEQNPPFPAGEDNKDNLPDDPLFGVQWALRNIGQNNGKEKADLDALRAWEKTKGKSDVVVAVLDTGVDYTHQDLTANIWTRPDSIAAYKDNELGTISDEHGFNASDNARDPMDENGHGTHCAGIIGAEGDNSEGIAGINWNVQIMPLKFLGRGGFGTTKDAIEAINYAIERKKAGVNIRVISASWGSTAYSRALEDVIRKAGEEGILFVAAAGNASTDNDSTPHYPSSYK